MLRFVCLVISTQQTWRSRNSSNAGEQTTAVHLVESLGGFLALLLLFVLSVRSFYCTTILLILYLCSHRMRLCKPQTLTLRDAHAICLWNPPDAPSPWPVSNFSNPARPPLVPTLKAPWINCPPHTVSLVSHRQGHPTIVIVELIWMLHHKMFHQHGDRPPFFLSPSLPLFRRRADVSWCFELIVWFRWCFFWPCWIVDFSKQWCTRKGVNC